MQFHNPKNLAISISLEAAELLEHFQWRSFEDSERHAVEQKAQCRGQSRSLGGW